MSKIYIGHHKAWKVTAAGSTQDEVLNKMGCDRSDLPDITFETQENTDYLLLQVPEEFRGKLSYMAYERGHSAGESEVELILTELIYELKPVIQAFEKRIRSEVRP